MLSHAQGIGHNRQRRVDGGAGREEAAVHDVQVVEIVRLTLNVQGRASRIVAETDRAVLMSDASERNLITKKQLTGEKALVTLVSVNTAGGLLFQQLLQLCDQ